MQCVFLLRRVRRLLVPSILPFLYLTPAFAETEIEALRREVSEQRLLIEKMMSTLNVQKVQETKSVPAPVRAENSAKSSLPSVMPSVSLYGVADVDVSYSDSGFGGKTNIGSGGMAASRLGIKGEKQLSESIKAVYLMEAGVAVNTGVVGTGTVTPGVNNNVASSGGLTSGGTQFFSRQIYAGLKLPFGTITAGRQYSGSYLASVSESTALGAGLFGSSGTFLPVVASMPTRLNNSVVYVSPNISGFTTHLTLTTGVGNNSDNVVGTTSSSTTDRAGKGGDLALFYASGRLKTAVTFWKLKNTGFNPSLGETGLASRKGFQLGANYDLGFAKINASYVLGRIAGEGYENGTKSLSKVTGWSLSGGIPIARGTLLASFTRVDDKSFLIGKDTDLIGVAYTYKLFDATTLYGNWGKIINGSNAVYSLPNGGDLVGTVATPGFNPTGLMIGLNQVF